MSRRTAEANKAIRLAWQREYNLIQEGKGTRDWTAEQQKDILDPYRGKAYDDGGIAFEGQHMKSVEKYSEYQGDPNNIQFLTKQEHLEAHQGNWQNPTNWYYDPVTKQITDFGENKYVLCPVIELTKPIITHTTVTGGGFVNTPKHDEKITGEPRTPSSTTKSDNTAKTAVVKPQITTEEFGFLKRLLGDAVKGFKKAGKFVVQYKEAIGTIAVAVGGVVLEEIIRDGNFSSTSKNSEDTFGDNDSGMDYGESTILDDKSEMPCDSTDTEKHTTHSSPCIHEVPGHLQRYHTKNGVEWRDKAPYPRGGKKDYDTNEVRDNES